MKSALDKRVATLMKSEWASNILPKTVITLVTMPNNKLVNSYFCRGWYSRKPSNRLVTADLYVKTEKER